MKNFIMKKMLARQLKDVPQAERDKLLKMFEKDPELFTRIAKETEEEAKKGGNQMHAMMRVASRHKKELEDLARKTEQ